MQWERNVNSHTHHLSLHARARPDATCALVCACVCDWSLGEPVAEHRPTAENGTRIQPETGVAGQGEKATKVHGELMGRQRVDTTILLLLNMINRRCAAVLSPADRVKIVDVFGACNNPITLRFGDGPNRSRAHRRIQIGRALPIHHRRRVTLDVFGFTRARA